MSAWLAIFRAEFRRAAYLLPWVFVLHAIMLGLRIERGLQLSPRLAGLAEWGTLALAALIVIPSLWADSPSVRDRFLATRPARPLLLHSAKLAALFLLAGLPFIAVEFANLIHWGWSGDVVLLGTLQVAIMVLVALLSACPLVWLWRGKIAGAIGTALMFVVVSCSISFAPLQLYASHGSPWIAAAKFQLPPVQLLTLAAVALMMSALLAFPGKYRHLAKTLLFLHATCLAVLMVMGICNRWPSPDPGETVPLVQLHLDSQLQRKVEELRVGLPAPPRSPDVGEEWALTKLIVNGRDFTPWPEQKTHPTSGYVRYDSASPAVQKALRLRYGSGLELPEPEPEYLLSPAQTLVSARDAAGKLDLDLTARRSLVGFEVAAELPFQDGASLRQGDLLWKLEKYRYPMMDEKNGTFARFTLRTPYIWLGSLEPEPDTTYLVFILYSDHRIKRLGSWLQGPTSARGRGGLRTFEVPLFEELGIRDDNDWPTGARLVVLRRIVLSQSSYSWKNPEPLSPRVDCGDRYPDLPDPGPGAVLPWLKQHPAPSATATGEEVSSWLSELLTRIRLHPPRNNSEDPGIEAATSAVATLVPTHPDRVHQALQRLPDTRNGARNVCWDAFERALRRDAVARFPQLMEDPVIRHMYVRKGWAADVLPYDVKQARLGWDPAMLGVLLENPEATGFSQAEWLAIFRLSPRGHVFRSLAGKVLPRELLEQDADLQLQNLVLPLSDYPGGVYPPLIDLALARGLRDAPAWFADWIPSWQADGARNPPAVGMTLFTYFTPPESANSDEAVIDWFLAQDPTAFRFDPVSGKYQLP